MNNNLFPLHNYGSGGAPAIPSPLPNFSNPIALSTLQQLQEESSVDQKTKLAQSVFTQGSTALARLETGTAAQMSGLAGSIGSGDGSHIEILTGEALTKLESAYTKVHVLKAKKFSEEEMKGFSEEQKKIVAQNFPKIELSLKELNLFFIKELKAKRIIQGGVRIGGSAAQQFLIDTPARDLDATYLCEQNAPFNEIKACVINFLNSKIPESFVCPVDRNLFVQRYLTKCKLILNGAKSFAIYGFGELLDVKFAYKSRSLRKTVALADGFWVDPELKIAKCEHLGLDVNRDKFFKGLDEVQNREYIIAKPQEVSELIFCLTKAMTKGFNVDSNYLDLAFDLIKKEHALERIGIRFQSLQNGLFKECNEIGRMLHFLNLMQILTRRLKLSVEAVAEGKKYIQAFAKAWIDTSPQRKTLQHFARLVFKYPEDTEHLIIVLQGILFRRWINTDSGIRAYDFEFHRNRNTARMYLSLEHANGTQYLFLPYNPQEMVEVFLNSVAFLTDKYQGADQVCFKELTNDLQPDSKKQPLILSLEHLTADLIESYDCPQIRKILSERFNHISLIQFYEKLQKFVEGTSNAAAHHQKLGIMLIERAHEEGMKLKMDNLTSFFSLQKDLMKNKASIQELNNFYQVFKKYLDSMPLMSSYQTRALKMVCEKLCKDCVVNSTVNERIVVQNILVLAHEHGLIHSELLTEFLALSCKRMPILMEQLPNVVVSRFIYLTMQVVCSPKMADKKISNVSEILILWCQKLIATKVYNFDVEDWIIFGLTNSLRLGNAKEAHAIKDLYLAFVKKSQNSFRADTLMGIGKILDECVRNNVIFSDTEQNCLFNVCLRGASSAFLINNTIKDRNLHFRYFLDSLKQIFQVDERFVKATSEIDFIKKPSQCFKLYMEGLIVCFPKHAIELFYMDRRYSMEDDEELKMRRFINEVPTIVVDPLFSKYLKWMTSFSSLSNEGLNEALVLLEKFSQQENGLRVILHILNLLKKNLHLLTATHKDLNVVLKKIFDKVFELVNSNVSYELVGLMNELINELKVRGGDRFNLIISKNELVNYYLNVLEVSFTVGLESCIEFLQDCLGSKDLEHDLIREKLFQLTLRCIEHFKNSFHYSAINLCHLILKSGLIPEYWRSFKAIYFELLQDLSKKDRQCFVIESCTYLLNKGCITLCDSAEKWIVFQELLPTLEYQKCSDVWQKFISSSSAEEIQKACLELSTSSQEQATTFMIDAFAKTGFKDGVICQYLLNLFINKPSKQLLDWIAKVILLDKSLLKFDEETQIRFFNCILFGFKKACLENCNNLLMTKFLLDFWNNLKTCSQWSNHPNKLEICEQLLQIWFKNGYSEFLIPAHDLICEMKELQVNRSLLQMFMKKLLQLPNEELIKIYQEMQFSEEMNHLFFSELMLKLTNLRLELAFRVLSNLNDGECLLVFTKRVVELSCSQAVSEKTQAKIKQMLNQLKQWPTTPEFLVKFQEFQTVCIQQNYTISCDFVLHFSKKQLKPQLDEKSAKLNLETLKCQEGLVILRKQFKLISSEHGFKFSGFVEAVKSELGQKFIEEFFENHANLILKEVEDNTVTDQRVLWKLLVTQAPYYSCYSKKFPEILKKMLSLLLEIDYYKSSDVRSLYKFLTNSLDCADVYPNHPLSIKNKKLKKSDFLNLRIELELSFIANFCKHNSDNVGMGLKRIQYLFKQIPDTKEFNNCFNSVTFDYVLLVHDFAFINCLRTNDFDCYNDTIKTICEMLLRLEVSSIDQMCKFLEEFIKRACGSYSIPLLVTKIAKELNLSSQEKFLEGKKANLQTIIESSNYNSDLGNLMKSLNLKEYEPYFKNLTRSYVILGNVVHSEALIKYFTDHLFNIVQRFAGITNGIRMDKTQKFRLNIVIKLSVLGFFNYLKHFAEYADIATKLKEKWANEMTAKLETAAAPKKSGSK